MEGSNAHMERIEPETVAILLMQACTQRPRTLAVPGLSLTAEQLFFVSYAQVWCGDNTAEYEVNKLLTNPHPPSTTRVTATLSNSEEFSKAFQCPPGAVMNPDKKCSLW